MAEVNFPSNSFSSRASTQAEQPQSKPEKPRQTRVVKGKVIKRKKNPLRQLIGTFILEDRDDIGSYILHDIVIPKVKDLLYDVVTGGTDRALYGEGHRPANRGGYTSYGRYYSGGGTGSSTVSYGGSVSVNTPTSRSISSIKTGRTIDDILFDSREEAEDVLADMLTIIEQYGSASVMDLYDLIGATSTYTDTQYGWFNLGSATVRHIRDGFILELPKPQYLN